MQERLRVVLDTNLHSDWSNEPCRLDAVSRARLERLLSDDRIELLVPGWIFVEFRWPAEKQRRWYARVGCITRNLSLLMGNLEAWEGNNALARLRGHQSSPPPINCGSAEELFVQMGVWHPSPEAATVRRFQHILSNLGGARGITGSVPKGVSTAIRLPPLSELKAGMMAVLTSEITVEWLRSEVV